MDFTERIPLEKAAYLKTMSLSEFMKLKKFKSKDDAKNKHKLMVQFCQGIIKGRGECKRLYGYSDKTAQGAMGRLFSGGSVQGLPKPIRGFLMSHTADIDMVNAHPTILKWICDKHSIPCPNLTLYIQDRDKYISQIADGKDTYLKALNNDKMNYKIKNPFFNAFDKEMKEIQKTLYALPEYNMYLSTPETKSFNWLGSTMNRIMCKYENDILQVAIRTLNRLGIEIAVLMFDGCMVYHSTSEGVLLGILRDVAEAFLGLNMNWKYKEHNTDIQIPEGWTEPVNEMVCVSDCQAGKLILKMLEEKIIFTNRVYFKKDHIRVCESEKVKSYLINFIMNSGILYKGVTDPFPKWADYSPAERLYKTVLHMVQEFPIDEDKFHTTTKYRLCFLNGVLDFRTRFYPWEEVDFEYYSVVQIPYNYKPSDIADVIRRDIMEPLFTDKLDTALHYLSRAFAGCVEDKNFATYLGSRNCGKSLQNVLYAGLGNYYREFPVKNLCAKNETSRDLYWLLEMEYTRLAVSQEVPEGGIKIQAELLKKICSGGDTQTARRNFDRQDTQFQVDCSIFAMGNYPIEILGDLKEHHIEFSGATQFKSQEYIDNMAEVLPAEAMAKFRIANPQIKELCATEEYRMGFIQLLVDSFKMAPLVVKEEEEREEKTVFELFNAEYEWTKNKEDKVLGKELEKFGKNVKAELKLVGIEYKMCKERNEFRDKMIFVGVKKRAVEQ